MKLPAYIKDLNKWKDEFSFYTTINIRFSETDLFGHMNNVSPFIYFEEARIKYMEHMDLFGPLTEKVENIPIVSDLQCDYLKQVYFNEQLKLYVKTNHIGTSSLDIHYMAKNNKEEIVFTGRGRIVQIEAKTGKPTPFNEVQIKKLEK